MGFRIDGSYPHVAQVLGRSVFELDISNAPTKLPPAISGNIFQRATLPRLQDYPVGAHSIVRRQWQARRASAVIEDIKQTRQEWLPIDNYLRQCLATMRRDNLMAAADLIERNLGIDPAKLESTAGITNQYLGWMTSRQITVVLAVIILNTKYQRPDDEPMRNSIDRLLVQWHWRLQKEQCQQLQAMQASRGAAWYVPRP